MSTKKVQSCQKNPENSYIEKNVKYKPSGYAWCSICSFDRTKNRRYFYRGKDATNGKIITYKLKFIDSYRFMSASLSNLVDNLSEIYDKECKKCIE